MLGRRHFVQRGRCTWRRHAGAVRCSRTLRQGRGQEVRFQLPALRPRRRKGDRIRLPRPARDAKRAGTCPCREDGPAGTSPGRPGRLHARLPPGGEDVEGKREGEGDRERAACNNDRAQRVATALTYATSSARTAGIAGAARQVAREAALAETDRSAGLTTRRDFRSYERRSESGLPSASGGSWRLQTAPDKHRSYLEGCCWPVPAATVTGQL